MSISSAFTSTVKALLVGSLLLLGSACAPLDGSSSSDVLTSNSLPASVSDNSGTTSNPTTDTGYAADYRIGVGDDLAINVWRNEDLSVTVPVRPDGRISVPLAGDIEVGKKTPEEVSAAITQKLAKYIRDPFVTVIVTNMGGVFRSRVRVTGAVEKPVSIPFSQGMTVLDLVLEAGGANEFANLRKATLFRSDGTRLPIRLDRILKRGDMETNHSIRPGDTVTIPQSAF